MRKRFLLLVFLYFSLRASIAQPSNQPSMYKFYSDIYDSLSKDPNYLNGRAPTDLSFIGLYKEALIQADRSGTPVQVLSARDSAAFLSSFYPVNAKEFVIEKAKENQIVIFNEAHTNPRNRVFVTSVLKALRDIGYSYFAAETFVNDSLFARDKHPSLFTGFYTMEPQFGNLVREAIKLNFTLWPYEAISPSARDREINQARNIELLLKKDPKAKIVIYCGHDHIIEDTIPGWGKAMAGRLKEFTGIDPYTFEQTSLTEKSERKLENPYFKLINSKNYTVLKTKQGQPFTNGKVDALIYYPRTKYIFNRPDWIFENNKIPYLLRRSDISMSFPVRLEVFYNTDDLNNSVPIDIIEIANENDVSKTAISIFRQGRFIISITNKQGKNQILKVSR